MINTVVWLGCLVQNLPRQRLPASTTCRRILWSTQRRAFGNKVTQGLDDPSKPVATGTVSEEGKFSDAPKIKGSMYGAFTYF